MGVKEAIATEGTKWIVIAGIIGVALVGFYYLVLPSIENAAGKGLSALWNGATSPSTGFSIATSNPITQAVTTAYLQQGDVADTGQGNYSQAVVDYTTNTPTFSSLIQQSTANDNNPILVVTPSGTGSYGGNLTGQAAVNATATSGVGSASSPYPVSGGWQGSGYYEGFANAPTQEYWVSTLSQFNTY